MKLRILWICKLRTYFGLIYQTKRHIHSCAGRISMTDKHQFIIFSPTKLSVTEDSYL